MAKGHTHSVQSVSVCGKIMVTGSSDKTIRVWDLSDNKEVLLSLKLSRFTFIFTFTAFLFHFLSLPLTFTFIFTSFLLFNLSFSSISLVYTYILRQL